MKTVWHFQSISDQEFENSTKYQDRIPCSFAYKFLCVDDEFSKPIVIFRGEHATNEFIKAILKEHRYFKKPTKNILTKIWSWVKNKNNFNQATVVGFVKNSLVMTMKKLEIIGTLLGNLEVQLIWVVTFVSSIN